MTLPLVLPPSPMGSSAARGISQAVGGGEPAGRLFPGTAPGAR